MQDQPFDSQALMARATAVAQEVRKSDAYPAVVGGIAGGIAGGLIAALIAGRVASARPASAETRASRPKESSGGWALRDLVQLVTVVATLAKQVQAWYQEQRKN
jgi:hypothetical protein